MADVADRDAAMLIAYETAVEALPPVTRIIFVLHRVDELPYRQIAERLSITIPAVECGLAEALSIIGAILDGETPRRWKRELIAEAEVELRERYGRYCRSGLRCGWWARAIRHPMPFEEWLADYARH